MITDEQLEHAIRDEYDRFPTADPELIARVVTRTAAPAPARRWLRPALGALALVAVLVLAVIVAGARHIRSPAGRPATGGTVTTPPATTGTVQGTLLEVGGPAPGTPRPVTGHVFATGGPSGQGGQTARDGTYVFELDPGTYTLTGQSPVYGDGKYICRARSPVVIRAGQTVHVDVICELK